MNTLLYPLFGTLFTFLMTTLGSALVFFFKDEVKSFYQQLFLGFAAGIMIAASVWSLLIPSMEMAEANGQNSALILGGGFIIGALFLLFLDHVIPHQHLNEDKPEGPKSMLGKNTMLVLAVTLHNIPEGFAVGLTFAIHIMQTILPVCLSFAAGAMMYVVVEELIPEAQLGKHSHIGTFGVLSGFVIMMLMDIFLG